MQLTIYHGFFTTWKKTIEKHANLYVKDILLLHIKTIFPIHFNRFIFHALRAILWCQSNHNSCVCCYAIHFAPEMCKGPGGSMCWVVELLTTHTSLSPIRRGFAPGFVNYKKECTRLAAASDKVYQLLAHDIWSPWYSWSIAENGAKHKQINQSNQMCKLWNSHILLLI